MVKFSSQWRSFLPFSGRLVGEVVLGLSLAHINLPSSGHLHSLGSNPWRRESLPPVFLTAFSCLLVHFGSPDMAMPKRGKVPPDLVGISGGGVAAALKLHVEQPVSQRTHRALCI